jgi:oligopeptide transport system substrate-binding protein
LAEAGYPDGKNFPAIQLKINNDGRKSIPVAVEIAKQLERNLKIRINMDMVSLSEKLADEYQGKSDIYRSGWTADYPSPESFLNLILW